MAIILPVPVPVPASASAFASECPPAEIIRTVPHIAFELDDLDRALDGKELIDKPSSPMDGVRVAMILHDGMPVELLEFAGTS